MDRDQNLDELVRRIRDEAARPPYTAADTPDRDAHPPAPAAPGAEAAGLPIDPTRPAPEHIDELFAAGDDVHFIDDLYRALLGRRVDPAGLDTGRALLAQGHSRLHLFGVVRGSPEARAAMRTLPGERTAWRMFRLIGALRRRPRLAPSAPLLERLCGVWMRARAALGGRALRRLVILQDHAERQRADARQLSAARDRRLDQLEHIARAVDHDLRTAGHHREHERQRALRQEGALVTLTERQQTQFHRLAEQGQALAERQHTEFQRLSEQAAVLAQQQQTQFQHLSQQAEVLTRHLSEQATVLTQQQQTQFQQLAEQARVFADRLAGQARDLDAERRRSELLLARVNVLQHRVLHAPSEPAGVLPVPIRATVHDEAPRDPALGSRIDAYYLAFEDAHRGSQADVSAKQTTYLRHLVAMPASVAALPMADIGCGRGEWLRLLQENGFEACGVDLNADMVHHCRAQGLHAHHADAVAWLGAQASASHAAISAFHVVEHLPFDVLFQLVEQAWRVLAPGGLLIFETPNPENVLVGSHTFYHDFSHRNPVTPTSLAFLVGYNGFDVTDMPRLSPYPEHDRVLVEGPLVDRFNGHFYGPQDYGMVARKPGGDE